MWPHQYYIWSLVDGTFRKSLEHYLTPARIVAVKKQFADEDLPGHLPWEFFFRHICSEDTDHGICAVAKADISKPAQCNCLQWRDAPAPIPEANDVGHDFGSDSDDD